MKLRAIGLGVQTLEAGPLLVLLSRSVPVAYRDVRARGLGTQWFKTDRWLGKATTRHINTWLAQHKVKKVVTVPHDHVVEVFESISRFSGVRDTAEV